MISWVDNEYSRNFMFHRSGLSSVNMPVAFIDINEGNRTDALLFSQIYYWHCPDDAGRSRLRHKDKDGRLWLFKNHSDWYDETRIPASTARKALDNLKGRKLIHYKLTGAAGKKTPFIRINWHEFERRMSVWEAQYPLDWENGRPKAKESDTLDFGGVPKMVRGGAQNGQGGCPKWSEGVPKMDEPNTETTTETTTKTTTESPALLSGSAASNENRGHVTADDLLRTKNDAVPVEPTQQPGSSKVSPTRIEGYIKNHQPHLKKSVPKRLRVRLTTECFTRYKNGVREQDDRTPEEWFNCNDALFGQWLDNLMAEQRYHSWDHVVNRLYLADENSWMKYHGTNASHNYREPLPVDDSGNLKTVQRSDPKDVEFMDDDGNWDF